jgi:hypothetical protein
MIRRIIFILLLLGASSSSVIAYQGLGVGTSVGLLCLSLIYRIHIISGPQFLAGFPPEMSPCITGSWRLMAESLSFTGSRLSGGSFKSGFLGSAVSYGASWSGAYEAAGVSSQANTWILLHKYLILG